MPLGRDLKLPHLFGRGNRGQNLACILVKIDLVKHELPSFLPVGQLVHLSEIARVHILVLLDRGRVLPGPLGLCVTPVQNARDGALRDRVVLAEVLQVEGDPAPVDHNGTRALLPIKVRVEGSDDLDALLTAVYFVDHDLLVVVEDALQSHGLHAPLLLELVQVGGLRPGKRASILGRHVHGGRVEKGAAPAHFVFFVFTHALLVFF